MTITAKDQYATVRHLPTDQAALRLGVSCHTVSNYRLQNPDVGYDPGPAQVRPGTVQHKVAMVAPSQSATINGAIMVRVTLPTPPAGVTFQREGAML